MISLTGQNLRANYIFSWKNCGEHRGFVTKIYILNTHTSSFGSILDDIGQVKLQQFLRRLRMAITY